ncbi:MAG: hypothetical protein IPP37_08025 [Saprospiraceae bacterium]|nr:hypothetical protein [Saprospiraceae bacterium]
MHRIFVICIFAMSIIKMEAQEVGIGTNNPDPSALLHLQSSNKGLLIPNMTQTERLAIQNPANGLLVYQRNTDTTPSGLYINTSFNPVIPSWVHITEGVNIWTPYVGNLNNVYSLNPGNVGIGVFDAGQKLSVAGGVTVDQLAQNNGGLDNALKFGGDNSGSLIRSNRLTATNQLGLDLVTNFNSRLSLTNAGNIGLGTTSPVNRLDVEGGVVIGINYSGTNTAPTNGLLVEGNLGLGTTSPVNKLDVEGGAVIGATYSGSNTAPANGLLVQGNVGIGTTNPLARLNVKGNGYGWMHSDNTDTVQLTSYLTTNATWLGSKTNHPLHFFTNDGTPQMTVATNLNVGIGTQTPNNFAALEVAATNKGLLLPRLNTTNMNALGSVAPDGMIVYNTDQNGLFLRRSGSFVKLIDVAATLTLPFSSTVNSSSNLFTVQNSGTGGAILATTNSNTTPALRAETNGTGRALEAISTSGVAGYFSTTSSVNTALYVGLGRVGFGTATPQSALDVEGGAAIGSTYSGSSAAPANGLIVQGVTGIGTNTPNASYMLDVNGRMRLRHNGITAGLWFNKTDNNPEGFLGMVSDTTLGIWGSTGTPGWRTAINLKNGNLGINMADPLKPLSFDNSLGNKIALWGSSSIDHYGMGIAGSTLRIYVPSANERFEFGTGNAVNFAEKVRITGNGNIYAGVTSSTYQHHLKSNVSGQLVLENGNAHNAGVVNTLALKTNGRYDALIRTTAIDGFHARLGFFTYSSNAENDVLERMSITDGGDVLIGTTNESLGDGYKLRVKGKIISEEVKVQLQAQWPDYVFAENYDLKPLEHVEKFIQTHHHLPNIPAASELQNSGIELGEMQRRMMEKIEELTLYMIELKKENETMKNQLDELKKGKK